ncbi:MAG: YhdP family protein [Gammaproteobacteria bacterium]|nr:YhdP family protein [Gammaproteobacteria bacterium]
MRFRYLLRVIRGLLGWTAFILLVLAAMYASLGRIVVTNLGTYKTEITARINSRLQINITMGNLTGVWNGINPGIDISNLSIGGSESGPGTSVGNLKIEIDSIASLMNGNWVIALMEVSDLNSEIEFLTDGKLQVAGLPLRDQSGDPTALVDLLVHTEHLSISGIQLKIKTDHGQYSLFQKADYPLELITYEELKTLSLRLDYERLDDVGEYSNRGSIEIIGEYSGDPREFDELYARAWLHITPISIQEFLPKSDYKGFSLDKFLLEGDFWLEFDHGRFDISVEFNAPVLTVKSGPGQLAAFEDMTGTIRVTGTGSDDWRAYLNGLKFKLGGRQWTPGNIAAVTYKTVNNSNLLIHCGALNVGRLADFGIEFGQDLIPERIMMMLQAMQPEGVLEDIYLYFRPDSKKPDFRLVSQLKSGKVSAYLGAPAITNLDSVISINPQEAWIDIHNSAFDIGFESISDEVWSLDSASGRLYIDYKQDFLRVGSNLLKIRKNDMVVSGKFHLNLTSNRRLQNWGLMLGIENGDISQKSLYLPNTLSKEVTEWLDEALVSGHLKDGGLLFHGSLSKDAEAVEKLHEFYFNVEDTTLKYHEDWPQLQSISGLVNVGNWGVSANQVIAKLYNSDLRVDVIMPYDADGQTSYVYVNGKLEGAAADGMKFINTTPVADMINHVSEDWTTEGDIAVDLKLSIPINYSLDDSGKPRYNFDGEIDTQMEGVDLYLPAYDLDIFDISSRINYTVSKGLNSERFFARLLGYPVQGNISTFYQSESDRSEGYVLIDFKGKTSIEELRDWSELTILHLAAGEFDYSASLTTPFGNQAPASILRADTDLRGIEIQIPAPLGKLPEEQVSFTYQSVFDDDEMKVKIDYADDFNAVLGIRNSVIVRGSLVFGPERAKLPETDGVKVSGVLANLNLDEWLRTHDRFTQEFEKATQTSFDQELESVVRLINLDVGILEVEDISLKVVELAIRRTEQAWNVNLSNQILGGRVTIYDDESKPIDVEIDYLRMTSETGGSDLEDPLAGLSARDLMPMQVRINEFMFNDENYGSWNFKLEPGNNEIKISDLYASVKGLEVGNEEQGGGFIEWLFDGIHQTTTFSGVVWAKDIAVAAKEWGYAPSIEGDSFVFDTKISWYGSPVMIAKESVRGAVKVKSKRGRFVQATGGGAIKVLGIFDFAALGRRFRFDFSDVLSDGYEFNEIEGEWWVEDGKMRIIDPITVAGSGSTFKVGGVIDIVSGDLDGDMIVTLPVSRNLPWYSAIVVSPMVGATVYLAQKVFQDQINQLSSAKYKVTGTIEEPTIEFVNIFDDSVRKEEKPKQASINKAPEPVRELP